jgi:hypothetical protein
MFLERATPWSPNAKMIESGSFDAMNPLMRARYSAASLLDFSYSDRKRSISFFVPWYRPREGVWTGRGRCAMTIEAGCGRRPVAGTPSEVYRRALLFEPFRDRELSRSRQGPKNAYFLVFSLHEIADGEFLII